MSPIPELTTFALWRLRYSGRDRIGELVQARLSEKSKRLIRASSRGWRRPTSGADRMPKRGMMK